MNLKQEKWANRRRSIGLDLLLYCLQFLSISVFVVLLLVVFIEYIILILIVRITVFM